MYLIGAFLYLEHGFSSAIALSGVIEDVFEYYRRISRKRLRYGVRDVIYRCQITIESIQSTEHPVNGASSTCALYIDLNHVLMRTTKIFHILLYHGHINDLIGETSVLEECEEHLQIVSV